MSEIFEVLNAKRIAEEIRKAKNRVIYVAPGLLQPIADAVIDAHKCLGFFSVLVVLDCGEKTCRLGYGTIESIQAMQEVGIKIRQHEGLRLGLLICDDNAWSFTPVSLCVEEEPREDGSPNALRLSPQQTEVLVSSIGIDIQNNAISDGGKRIGKEVLKESEANFVASQLEIAPPIQFNVFRQVLVFLPYIQYVDLSLQGCSINRRSVRIPPDILRLAPDNEIEERLRTTLNLIDKESELSDEGLQKELRRIRETYLRPLGRPWGNVILRSKRGEFDKEIERFKGKLKEHQERLREDLKEEIEKSINQIAKAFAENIKNNPPRTLVGGIQGAKPTLQEAENWLRHRLRESFPKADKLITKMELTCFFRDVTYETLKHEGFEKALKKAYPALNWDKPFKEFQAAEAQSEIE